MILRPIARFTANTTRLDNANPQNPHFFHLNRATAQIRLIIAIAMKNRKGPVRHIRKPLFDRVGAKQVEKAR